MHEQKQTTRKWLRILLIIQLAVLILTLLNRIPLVFPIYLGGNWIPWAIRGLHLMTVVCLFSLPTLYRKAAVLKAIWLVGSLLNTLVFSPVLTHSPVYSALGMERFQLISNVASVLISILYWIALFLEYRAHGALGSEKNTKHWYILYICSVALTLILNIMVILLQVLFETMVQNGMIWGITLYNAVSYLPNLAIQIVYLVLLRRTIQITEKEE